MKGDRGKIASSQPITVEVAQHKILILHLDCSSLHACTDYQAQYLIKGNPKGLPQPNSALALAMPTVTVLLPQAYPWRNQVFNSAGA